MAKFWRHIKEADAPASYFHEWTARAQTAHGAVFGYIESLIVLGALQFAVLKTSYWAVWVIYGIAFLAQVTLTSTYARVALLLALDRFELSEPWRHRALVAAWVIGVAVNIALMSLLDEILRQLIAAGLAGEEAS